MTMIPAIPVMTSARQLSLSAVLGCATAALPTLEVQGIAARPATANAVFAPFASPAADAAKRERTAGTAHRGNAATVWGSPAWSPPI
ncbi:hypothetical protein [Nocardioides humi]|nr:hypothetical protein [Nocardioides humi]